MPLSGFDRERDDDEESSDAERPSAIVHGGYPETSVEVDKPNPDGGLDVRVAVVTAHAVRTIPLKLNRKGAFRDNEARALFALGIVDVLADVNKQRQDHEQTVDESVIPWPQENTPERLRAARDAAEVGRTDQALTKAGKAFDDLETLPTVTPFDHAERVVKALAAVRGGEPWDVNNAAVNMPLVAKSIDEQLAILAGSVGDAEAHWAQESDITRASEDIVRLAHIGADMADVIAKDSRYQDVFPRSIAQQFRQLAITVAEDPHSAGRAAYTMSPSGQAVDFGAAVHCAASSEGRDVNLSGPMEAFCDRPLNDRVSDIVSRVQRAPSDVREMLRADELDSSPVELFIPVLRQPSPTDIAGRSRIFELHHGREPNEAEAEAIASAEFVRLSAITFDSRQGIDGMLDIAGRSVTELRDTLHDNAGDARASIRTVGERPVIMPGNEYVSGYVMKVAPYVNRLDVAISQCREMEPGRERTALAQEIVVLAAETQRVAYEAIFDCHNRRRDDASYRRRDAIVGKLVDAVPSRLQCFEDQRTPSSSEANDILISYSAREQLKLLDRTLSQPSDDTNPPTFVAPMLKDLRVTLGALHRPRNPLLPSALLRIDALAKAFETHATPDAIAAASRVVLELRASGVVDPTGIKATGVLLRELRDDPKPTPGGGAGPRSVAPSGWRGLTGAELGVRRIF